VLRKLSDVIVRSLLVIFEWAWLLGDVPEDWKRANITIFDKGKKEYLRNYLLNSLTAVPGKVMQKILLEIISKHMEDKMTGSYQHRFAKEKSYLTSLIAFCN